MTESSEPPRWPPDRVRTHFGRAELMPLWQRLRQRFETGRVVSRVTVGRMAPDERSAVADLLGMDRLPDPHTQVSLARLDALFAETTGYSTREISELLGGELRDRAQEARDRTLIRSALRESLLGHPVVREQPVLRPWAELVLTGGLTGPASVRRQTLETTLAVLEALPSDGRPLPALAAQVCGDPHALDAGRRVPGLVVRALAALHGINSPLDVEQRRALWAMAGVACDELSTVVLAAGLRPAGDHPVPASLRSFADSGIATAVTLAQLKSHPELNVPRAFVSVVENPSIMAMALHRYGATCPPLICTSGWPNSAAIILLRGLTVSGCSLRYHGDFDGEGIRIAAHVFAKTGAQPWRMSGNDYAEALARPQAGESPGLGRVTDAPWDPNLAELMLDAGRAVHEEHVAQLLIEDLMLS